MQTDSKIPHTEQAEATKKVASAICDNNASANSGKTDGANCDKASIFLLEDDAMIRSGLEYALQQEGYTVIGTSSVKEAKRALESKPLLDLALLDINLPDGTSFEVRDSLRSSSAAVIFLTVVDDEGNIVRAFEQGADDYITKPFRLSELLARIKRTLSARGGIQNNASSTINFGDITIDTSAGMAYKAGAILDLTALEYRLLLLFASHPRQLFTRAQILENVWGIDSAYIEDNTLTVYIKRLREKLGEGASIETVRGLGYRSFNATIGK